MKGEVVFEVSGRERTVAASRIENRTRPRDPAASQAGSDKEDAETLSRMYTQQLGLSWQILEYNHRPASIAINI